MPVLALAWALAALGLSSPAAAPPTHALHARSPPRARVQGTREYWIWNSRRARGDDHGHGHGHRPPALLQEGHTYFFFADVPATDATDAWLAARRPHLAGARAFMHGLQHVYLVVVSVFAHGTGTGRRLFPVESFWDAVEGGRGSGPARTVVRAHRVWPSEAADDELWHELPLTFRYARDLETPEMGALLRLEKEMSRAATRWARKNPYLTAAGTCKHFVEYMVQTDYPGQSLDR